MQHWMDVLQNGITHALHTATTPEKEHTGFTLPPTSSTSSLPPVSSSSATHLLPFPNSASPVPPVLVPPAHTHAHTISLSSELQKT